MLALGPLQQGETLTLGLRTLYILPTRFGLLWLAGLALLQVVAIQLESNNALLLSFLMLALFLLALHLTHLNLQGMELRCGQPAAGFVGAELAYPLRLRCRGRCEGLQLALGSAEPEPPRSLPPGEHRLNVHWRSEERGYRLPGRLTLLTRAPLGLFVCWSRWQPPVPQLVIPAPLAGPVGRREAPRAEAMASESGASQLEGEGGDQWHDLRPHRPEDGSTRMAWKLLAQGRGAHSKRFAAPPRRIDLLAPAPGIPLERALRHLSAAILRLDGEGIVTGLALPGGSIPPGQGPQHRSQCLEALALCPRERG